MKKLSLLVSALVICCNISVYAQKYLYPYIPVVKRTGGLSMPWTGGYNTPQFSSADIDGDGRNDLFVYDKSGDKMQAYLNDGSATDTALYHYSPKYEFTMPEDLFSWAIFKDFNQDGTPDLFTHTNSGIRLFKGRRDNFTLYFDLYSDLLKYNDGGFSVNIYTAVDDIPAIEDVDRDGDLDVLTFGVFGTTVEYYINQSVERGFGLDSLQFITGDLCWGGFAENSLNNSVSLGACRGGGLAQPTPSGSRHTGSTILAYDMDGDGDLDMLLGDVAYSNLVQLTNGGDSSFAEITSYDTLFPACGRMVDMDIFPAAFRSDINNDGLQDLLIAPNTRAIARDVNNVSLYKLTGNACPYEYRMDSFLVEDMLDFGSDAKPILFDFNGDGKQDLLCGNYGYYRPFNTVLSTIALYENQGTDQAPLFKERTFDVAGISAYNFVAVYPAIGDLDGDSKADLLVGEQFGTLQFFKNTGGTVANFNTLTTPNFFNLDVGQFATPFIFDVNHDGLNDLVCGRKDGKLTYFWNYGTPTAPLFSMDSSNNLFGGVNVTIPGYTEGNSAPVLYTDSSSGKDFMLVGSKRGLVYHYEVDSSLLRSGSFTLLDTNFLKYRPGYNATVVRYDINHDGYMDYLIGNSRGGLQFMSDTLLDSSVAVNILPIEKEMGFRLYPNPAGSTIYIAAEAFNAAEEIRITDISGREVMRRTALKLPASLQVSELPRGFYWVQLNIGGQWLNQRFLKE